MTDPTLPSIRPQPMLAVTDVERSSRWYQLVLGAESDHGGREYERLLVDGELVMQLHSNVISHHHEPLADPGQPVGNGVVVWFEAGDFDGVVERIRGLDAEIVTDVHVNPNARHREIWLRDPDGFLVVISGR